MDPRIGMVQTRWEHMNRDHSLLTSIQALMLDGHHMVENRARFGAGNMFNFSGTGGMWRRQAIDDVLTPAELPEDMSSFRAQQYRWAKGTVQTARKLLVRVAKSELTLAQRIEACFHMLPHMAYPMMVLLTLLLLPALVFMPASDVRTLLLIDLPLCIGATGSLATFYAMAEIAQGRSAWGAMKRLPALIALGAGLAPHLSSAVFDGMRSMAGEFVRTPKRGEQRGRYRQYAKLPLIEMALAAVCAGSVVASVETGHYFATPFAALFMSGYAYVATLVIQEQFGFGQADEALAPESSRDGAAEAAGMAPAA